MSRQLCASALVFLLALSAGNPALAQEKAFELTVSDDLVDSGLVRHLVPRFSMKTGVQITLDVRRWGRRADSRG